MNVARLLACVVAIGSVSACAERSPRPPTPPVPTLATGSAATDGVTFTGNRAITSDALAARVWGVADRPLVGESLERATLEIERSYHDRGYAKVRIRASRPEGGDALLFEIEEGDVFRLGQVTIRGDVPTSDHPKYLALLGVRPGEIFNRSAIAAGRERVVDAFVATGQPDAIVLPFTKLDSATRTIDLVLELTASAR